MLKHLLKLIWNKKKQNFLLMVEMLISFLIMFAVFTLAVYNYQNLRRPMGMEYKDVWALSFYGIDDKGANQDSLNAFYGALKQSISNAPEVAAVSYISNNSPFSMSTSNSNVSYKKITVMADQYATDDDYARVLKPVILSGRWYSKQDDAAKYPPVVINNTLKEQLFPAEDPLGKLLPLGDDRQLRIVGVVQDMKDKGDYQPRNGGLFTRTLNGNYGGRNRMLVKIKPGADPGFESRLYKQVAGMLPDATVEIEHLTDKRILKNNMTLVPLLIVLVIAGFLVINVSLGLFGVLWYNISKRKAEIGLRRAIGASGNAITRQVVNETLVLTTLSLLLGLFFAVQFPLLNIFNLPGSVYVPAIVLATLFIYLLVVVCAFYPGRQAANIYPAVALHED